MFTTSTEGVDLYYESSGEGEPLLLLPGAGQSSIMFLDNGLAEMFARRFQVILMDFTGLGKSGRVTDMKPAQWAEDVISVLDALEIERIWPARRWVPGLRLGSRPTCHIGSTPCSSTCRSRV
jgi:pimeloyl-ACP methyl ester carboxylesterase